MIVQDLTGFLPEVDTQGLVTYSPSDSKLGDVNDDGHVNFLDIAPFISLLSTGSFDPDADINQDTTVNFLDISGFINLLASGS